MNYPTKSIIGTISIILALLIFVLTFLNWIKHPIGTYLSYLVPILFILGFIYSINGYYESKKNNELKGKRFALATIIAASIVIFMFIGVIIYFIVIMTINGF
jgi:hypothetical protein